MNTKNTLFTLVLVLIANNPIHSSNSDSSVSPVLRTVSFKLPETAPQELLVRGLHYHDTKLVRTALTRSANPNAIAYHSYFGERTWFNAYLAQSQLDCEIVALMLSYGALPTVDTDHILDKKDRHNPLKTYLRTLVAKRRQQIFRAETDERIMAFHDISCNVPPAKPTTQRHVDPTA